MNTQPMCTDEDEGVKCPSGCRLQALINEADGDVYQRLISVCEKTKCYRSASASTVSETSQFYDKQRRRIVRTYMEELRYAEVAQTLHRNLTLLWKKTSELSRGLQQNHKHIQDQINEIHKLEVDIDIKLRACKGSCKQTFDHVPDHETSKSMQDEMTGFDFQLTKPKILTLDKKLTLQPVDRPEVPQAYRRLPFIHSKLLTKFEDIEQNQVVVDEI
ncbi:fibrinogen alpha chain [Clarias gariepinus]|uniref:fibrinogen alpha chain n=1 Tax=Clarias gariepinus TaxID=13013 RepID=UPI00234DFB3B|nr:fibrinogen alpha chain [Clarias gariepinus]